jgi:hypothetical protein
MTDSKRYNIQIVLIDINGQKLYPEFITVSLKNKKQMIILFFIFSL